MKIKMPKDQLRICKELITKRDKLIKEIYDEIDEKINFIVGALAEMAGFAAGGKRQLNLDTGELTDEPEGAIGQPDESKPTVKRRKRTGIAAVNDITPEKVDMGASNGEDVP